LVSHIVPTWYSSWPHCQEWLCVPPPVGRHCSADVARARQMRVWAAGSVWDPWGPCGRRVGDPARAAPSAPLRPRAPAPFARDRYKRTAHAPSPCLGRRARGLRRPESVPAAAWTGRCVLLPGLRLTVVTRRGEAQSERTAADAHQLGWVSAVAQANAGEAAV